MSRSFEDTILTGHDHVLSTQSGLRYLKIAKKGYGRTRQSHGFERVEIKDLSPRLFMLGDAHEVHAREMHVYELHTHEMHTCEVHAHEVHAREVHAHEVHAREVHAHEVHACEMHVYEVHTHEMHSCEVHAYEMHGPMRHAPMR